MMDIRTGQLIVFTGEGKGKTTAALGLAVASAANGKNAVIVQFLKGGGYTGELFAQPFLAPNLIISQFGFGCEIAAAIKSGKAVCRKCGRCFRENRNPSHNFAGRAMAFATKVLQRKDIDLLVLDEISHAIRHQLLSLEEVLEFINTRPAQVTLVLTGRHMSDEIIKLAQQVTECAVIKHPLHQGIDARRGTEY